MKIMVFGIGKKELPVATKWAEEHHYELGFTDQELTAATVHLAEGSDAISFQQMKAVSDEAVYHYLKENNIHFLSTRSAGIDGLPKSLLKKYGIKAANVPVYSPKAIAEFALTLTMMLLRNQPRLEKRRAKGSFVLDGLIGREIHALTVGIVGTGHIGLTTAEIFKHLGATVIGYDKFPKDNVGEILTYVDSLEELAAKADVISLHTPYVPENHHLIDAKIFTLMKEDAVIVNTARGPIIDTAALIDALHAGKIGGAALDTLENETDFVNQTKEQQTPNAQLETLLAMDNVIVTPHMAFYTLQASEALMKDSLQSLDEFLKTGTAQAEISLD